MNVSPLGKGIVTQKPSLSPDKIKTLTFKFIYKYIGTSALINFKTAVNLFLGERDLVTKLNVQTRTNQDGA